MVYYIISISHNSYGCYSFCYNAFYETNNLSYINYIIYNIYIYIYIYIYILISEITKSITCIVWNVKNLLIIHTRTEVRLVYMWNQIATSRSIPAITLSCVTVRWSVWSTKRSNANKGIARPSNYRKKRFVYNKLILVTII